MQDEQHEGQSGGPTANGCGYLGLSHVAESSRGAGAIYAGSIGADTIVEFVKEHFETLPERGACSNITSVVAVPMMPLISCGVVSTVSKLISVSHSGEIHLISK